LITNVEIADVFEEMADLLELSGENAFRIRAYRNGAKAIRDSSDSIASLIEQGADLTTIDGIGSTLAEKSQVLVKTGRLPQLDKLRLEVPPTLRDIMQVPGVGAKKAMKLFQELQVFDLPTLRAACEAGLVASLKGFGEKTQQPIVDR
jgi:DNA polymerase (family X)